MLPGFTAFRSRGRGRLAACAAQGAYETFLTNPSAIAASLQFERSVQFGNKAILRVCAVHTRESAMREAEYERLLDAVSDAVARVPEEDSVASLMPTFMQQPKAANDNQLAWPLIPFPEGWDAAC